MRATNVHLEVVLDHNDGILRAQSWVYGHVSVEFRCQREAKSLGELQVRMVGKETTFSNTPSLPCFPSGVVQEKHIVFEERKTVHTFGTGKDKDENSTFHSGSKMVYPFAIYLPSTVPATMSFYDDEHQGGGGCSVEYAISASIQHVAGSAVKRVVKVVGPTLSNKHYSHVENPIYKQLHGGFLAFGTRAENTHVGKGQNLAVAMACRNRSTHCKIADAKCRILEEVHWKAPRGGAQVQEQTVLAVDQNLDLFQNQNGSSGNADALDRNEVEEMQLELANESNCVSMIIPARARDSYEGSLIQVHHFFEVQVSFENKGKQQQAIPSSPKNMTKSNMVSFRVPIKVFDPPIVPAISKTPSAPKIAVTTTWPEDEFPVQSHDHHHHHHHSPTGGNKSGRHHHLRASECSITSFESIREVEGAQD